MQDSRSGELQRATALERIKDRYFLAVTLYPMTSPQVAVTIRNRFELTTSEKPAWNRTRKLVQMDIPLSSASILLFFILVQRSLQQCYARSGGISPHDIPCTEFATDSDPAVPCCEAGRKCTSNRMCVSTDVDTDLKRGTCTDESWNSPHCPQYCLKCKLSSLLTRETGD